MSTPNTHEGALRIHAYLRDCAQNNRPVFFIGVGGVMMSSLALLTARAGHPVHGSDRTATPLTDAMAAALTKAWALEADFLDLTLTGSLPPGGTWDIHTRGRLLPPAGQEAQP